MRTARMLLFTWVATLLVGAGCDDGSPTSNDGGADARADTDPDVADAEGHDGSSSDADARDGGDAEADSAGCAAEPGTWECPIVVDVVPFGFAGDTSRAPAREADRYSPCAPATDESGGEYVFVVEVDEPARLRVEINDAPGDLVDIDVHVLDTPSAESCVARGNVHVEHRVEPGTWWVAADTWVRGDGTVMAGPFQLWLRLEPLGSDDCTTSPIDCDETDTPAPDGVPSEAAGVGPCPRGMVRVSDFCIDRYEAMLVEVRDDGSLGPWSPYANPGSRRVRALSVAGVVPQGYLDQVQAAAACRESGKRLCTDEQWLRACRGTEERVFPNGDTVDTGACNVTRTCHPAVQYFETTADWIWSELGHPCLNQLPDGLARAGEHPRCVTPEGVHDLVGNLHEWTDDPAGTFRGGFYVDAEINGRGCLYRTTAHDVSHWDYSTGFRCCAD